MVRHQRTTWADTAAGCAGWHSSCIVDPQFMDSFMDKVTRVAGGLLNSVDPLRSRRAHHTARCPPEPARLPLSLVERGRYPPGTAPRGHAGSDRVRQRGYPPDDGQAFYPRDQYFLD